VSFSRSVFVPRVRYVSNITNDQQAIVTMTVAHDFIVGEIISLRVSRPYNMVQANNLQATVVDTTSTTVTLDLDTTNFFVFVDAGQDTPFPALAVPVGSGIIPGALPAVVQIDDAFDDVPLF
jgi:hypothetical protein